MKLNSIRKQVGYGSRGSEVTELQKLLTDEEVIFLMDYYGL